MPFHPSHSLARSDPYQLCWPETPWLHDSPYRTGSLHTQIFNMKSLIVLIAYAAHGLASPLDARGNFGKSRGSGSNRGNNDNNNLFAGIDKEAFKEAHQRDDTATRALSDIQIQNSNGDCLFVDPSSGDFRANLTPVQTAACGSTPGQGWDIITSGQHNDRDDGFVLIVSTLTQACLNADPRRDPGDQINLFSCGGRADGGGEVTDSQLWAADGPLENMRFSPRNGRGFCLTGEGENVDITNCEVQAAEQRFVLAGDSGQEESSSSRDCFRDRRGRVRCRSG